MCDAYDMTLEGGEREREREGEREGGKKWEEPGLQQVRKKHAQAVSQTRDTRRRTQSPSGLAAGQERERG